MAKLLKLRGGTTSQHSSFTGALREVTVDTDKDTLVVHDGSTAGGFPLARADGSGSTNFTITGELDAGSLDISGNADIDGTLEADAITLNGTALGSLFSPLAGGSNIVTTGAINSGSITSGFGNIDTGSSTITTTGAITGGTLTGTLQTAAQTNITSVGTLTALTVDDITIDGSTISDAGDITIDVAGDIILDADGSQVIFADGGTNMGEITNDGSSNFVIRPLVQDKDFLVKGNDGGSAITALTLDMSNAGAATFNNDVTAFSDKRLKTDISNIENGIEKVMQMQGVHYKRNDVEDAKPQIGVLAQDMEAIVPEVVLTADDEMQTKSVDYGKLTAVLIEAIKDLKAEIDELKGK